MRKYLILLVFSIILYNVGFSQNASDYFPSDMGHKWFFKDIPLDSLNNEVDSEAVVEVDSFAAANTTYKGRSADLILGKLGLPNTILLQPYTDSSFVSFEGSNAYSYFSGFDFVIPGTTPNGNVLGKKLSQLTTQGLVSWQLLYQFGATANSSYSIFTVDTTLTLNSNPYQFRVIGTGERLGSENITTDGGNYNAEKFVINIDIDVNFLNQYIKILTIPDTSWIAQGDWIVKSVSPSVAFSGLPGVPGFYVPGHKNETIQPIVTAIKKQPNVITDFHLYQNYPNPFNPSTRIQYSVSSASKVKLVIYNVLGREVTTLVDKEQNPGTYKVDFNPSRINGGLPSGIYFYRLESQNKFAVKKLIYLK
jgi:hypothetical protein